MAIRQGDVYWIDLDTPDGSEPGYRRPHVVLQNDLFNSTGIRTVIVCALTTNLKRAAAPGNVLLEPGEGQLPNQSVVNVSQLLTVDKVLLDDKIGSLSPARIRQIIEGIQLLIEPLE
jgi:mRNA interferase MazF